MRCCAKCMGGRAREGWEVGGRGGVEARTWADRRYGTVSKPIYRLVEYYQ